MKILILNGPNLNLLGIREKSIYGSQSFDDFFKELKAQFASEKLQLEYYHSNVEGELINKLHDVGFSYDGIIFNAGGYTHTSIAISDAIAGINTPVIEVHISNVYSREDYRHKSFLSKNCKGVISGFGLQSYTLALQYLISNNL